MKPDRGAVLINALVVVLAISAIAVAMLTRSEEARHRAASAQDAEQLDLYLDAAERLVPQFFDGVLEEFAVYPAQSWARSGISYPIDRGQVSIKIEDLAGRLNVNWLLESDDYVSKVFRDVFAEVGVPPSLVTSIEDFISPGGPSSGGYLSRRPPIVPRGGPMQSVEDLREVAGMRPDIFAKLSPVLSALPRDTQLNLNTATDFVKRAAIDPLPKELIGEIMDRKDPIIGMAEIRQRATDILGTEDLDDLPFDRITFGSRYFRAELTATLGEHRQRRIVVFELHPSAEIRVQRRFRWAVYD